MRCPETDWGATLTISASTKASSVVEWLKRLDHQKMKITVRMTNPSSPAIHGRLRDMRLWGAAGETAEGACGGAAAEGAAAAGAAPGGAAWVDTAGGVDTVALRSQRLQFPVALLAFFISPFLSGYPRA